MKNKHIIALCTLSILFISGCSLKEDIKNIIIKESGLYEKDQYKKYENCKNNGQIDENDHFIEPKIENVTGDIKITFFSSNYIKINYFYDKERTNMVDIEKCYIDKGDSLYYEVSKKSNEIVNQYELKRIELCDFSEENDRNIICSFSVNDGFFTIPSDYTGNHLSIMPAGEFTNRLLSFDAYLVNQNVNEKINGKWYVNGEYCGENKKEIHPTLQYEVRYEYNEKKEREYYYYNAEPKPKKVDDENGIIEFPIQDYNSSVYDYKIELKKYKKITIDDKNKKQIQSIEINDHSNSLEKDKKLKSISKIKVNDYITIEVNKEYKIDAPYLKLINENEKKNSVEYKYLVVDNDVDELFIRCVKETATLGGFKTKQIENGYVNVISQDSGVLLVEGQKVDDNAKIKLKIIAYANHYVSGKDTDAGYYEKIMKYKDYVNEIDEIVEKHLVKEYITVTLDPNDNYGKCIFIVNQKENVEDKKTVKLREGDAIECKYELKNENYKYSGIVNLFKSKSVKKIVNQSMNEKTYTREDFIEIVRK